MWVVLWTGWTDRGMQLGALLNPLGQNRGELFLISLVVAPHVLLLAGALNPGKVPGITQHGSTDSRPGVRSLAVYAFPWRTGPRSLVPLIQLR